jgi:hypothetical protein
MKKALLIGIDYVNIPSISLRGCINDIINVRNMLIDAYDYDSKNIIIIRDDDPTKFPLPTRKTIMDNLHELSKDSENLEEIWLHYSGHGSQLQHQNSDVSIKERDGLNEILVPIDYETEGFILDYELLNIIKNIKCRAILVFDCCHSGTICDLPWMLEVDSSNNIIKTNMNDTIIENKEIFVLSGCKDAQKSADTNNNFDQSVGAFSNALLECLRDSHHNIEVVTLYKNVCYYLSEKGYSQSPILSSTNENPIYLFKRNNI